MAQTINKQRFISCHRLARIVCTVLLATLVQAAAARSPHVARIVADPNAESQHRPTILSTADGLPLINIQTPNDQGLSKNDYIQFDADRGLSWNNDRTQNPHLLARSARTILNQVNSSHPSYLKGPLTVLGDRAQVIIANPSGLHCEGCGFINVHRATLTTGTPIINKNGLLDGYRVQHGLISVQGGGLQSSTTDYTELIARAVLINEQLQANQLKIITGANLVSGDVVTPLQQPASSAPVLAIDVAELGGLYANKIKLVGTEAGVGVRNAGHIGLEAGQIKITVNGFLDNSGEIDSRRPARIETAQGTTPGHTRHEGTLDITTRGPLINRGMLTAHGHTTLHTGSARLNNSGQIATMNDLSIASADLNNSTGSIKAVGRLRAQVPGTTNNQAGLIHSNGMLRVTTGHLNNANTQGSEHGVAGKKVTIQADSINNQVGSIQTDGALTLIGTTQIDNRLGSISSRQAVALQALAGTSPADKRLSILNTGGTVLAGTKLTVDSQSLSGDGQIHSNEQLDIKLLNDLHNTGKITAGGDATLSLTGALHNRQTLDAGHRLTVSAASIDNTSTGEINAGHTQLVALESLTNRGLIHGDETLIQADKVNNLGTGRIYGDHIAIGATTLDNGAETVHGVTSAANVSARKRLDIGVQSLTNREHGLLGSEGNFALGRALDGHHRAIGQAEKFDNSSATLEALGDLNLTVDTLNNTNAHFTLKTVPVGEPSRTILIQPEGDPNRYPEHHFVWEGWSRAGQYRHQNWEVTRFTKYDVTRTETQSVVNRSDPGKIVAGGDLRLTGRDLNNDKSQLIAGGRIIGDLSNLRNLEAEGRRTVQEAGSSQYSTPRYRGRWKNYHTRDWNHPIPYTPADEIHTITVPVTKVLEHTHSTRSGAQTPALSRNLEEISIPMPSDIPGHPGTMMRTQMPAITLPNHTLFRHNPKPDSLTLIETDPHLTRSHKKLDAEYMLKRMAQNPAVVQKRLGDGFYEQRLVGEQINQLTGRRFLHHHTNDEVQYRALMEQGLHFADQLKLRPGIALSAAQMAQLTSDIVWPVQREVALADGAVQKVLVPQVYAYVKEGDLKGDGTLISGRALKLSLRQDMMNKGTMTGRTKVNVDAEEIKNLGGKITGGETILHARTDLDNHGAALTGGTHLVVRADRDLNLLFTTQQGAKTAGASHFSRTHLDRVASLTSHGSLSASAGRDATFTAAEINNTSPDNQTTLTAGHNLNLGALTVGYQENMVGDANNFLKQGLSDEIGSTIQTVGNLQLAAGHNFTAKAANLTSQQGALTATAEHNVNITAGQTQHNFDEGHSHTRRGLFSSSSSATRETINQTQATGSLLSGNTIKIKSGQNLTVHGSDVVANQQVSLAAEGDIHLSTAQNTASHSRQSQQQKSGLLNGGGVGIMIGSQTQHDQAGEREITHTDSTIASLTGDVTIVSGKDTQLKASGVYAGQDLNVTGQNITLDTVPDVLAQSERHTFKQSGLSVGLGGEIVEKAKAIYHHLDRASKVKDPRLKAVKQAQAVYALDQLSSAAVTGSASGTQGAAGGKSVRLELSIGSSQSEHEAHTIQTTARGSNLVANRRVNIMATGDGHAKSGDLTVKGSQIKGKEVNLAARHDLVFESVANTGHHQSKQNSSGFTAGVGVSLGQQSGLALFASGQVANGHADGKSAQYANSSVIATDTLTLTSGRDATLTGAQLSGQKIKAEIGRNLTLTSQQDSDAYHQGQTNLSAGLSGVLGAGGVSGSLAVSREQVKSRYASVNLPTGLIAGKEGFEIQVGKHTQLNGAQIANAAPSKSVLNTDTLGFTDLQNKAQYEARSSGFSASYGGAASAKQNIVANSLANAPSGLGLTGTEGVASSTTQTAISPARIEVRRDQETGQDSTQGLRRDPQNAHQTLQKIFDLQEVQEKIELGRESANLGMQVSGDLANKLAAQNPDSKLWGEGQLGRIGLHAAVAGLGAQMTGGNVGGAIAGTVAGDLASSKISERINQATAGMTNPNAKQTVSNVVTNMLAGTAGAIVGGAVGGQSGALAGAGGALVADQFNRQLHPQEKEWIKKHASAYAKRLGITDEQANEALATQANLQVQSGSPGTWNEKASTFLGQAHGMLPEEGNSGPGYMFYAVPNQKANPNMYAGYYGNKTELNIPASNDIIASVDRENLIRGKYTKATLGAAAIAAGGAAAPWLASVGGAALQACAANPMLCVNQATITAGEIAAGDALPVGVGAAVVGMAVKEAKVGTKIAGKVGVVPTRNSVAISQAGRNILVSDGYYQAEGLPFRFSEYYYDRLWSTGRGAPFVQAAEVLNTAVSITPDRKAGFYRYSNKFMEMIYNPTTKEVWHLQPLIQKK